CHSEILMPKDTESLGNNKAPACESRGFVRKIMKVCILTHLLVFMIFRLSLKTALILFFCIRIRRYCLSLLRCATTDCI
ncbi:hypothetical protein, partial [Bacteroides stercoris]|uniref:hypothetical protein n=1 Tax=Bacteroides stercoris TaxID=46506 RepID=UPI0021AB3C23